MPKQIFIFEWLLEPNVEPCSFTTSDQLFIQPVLSDYTLGHVYFLYRDEDDLRCPICSDEYQRGDLIVSLTCSHTIHLQCAMSWFLESGRLECLQCKKPIIRDHVKTIAYTDLAPLLSTLQFYHRPALHHCWLYDKFGNRRSTSESVKKYSSDLKLQDFLYSTRAPIVMQYAKVLLRLLDLQDDVLALGGRSMVFDKDGFLIADLQDDVLALGKNRNRRYLRTMQPDPQQPDPQQPDPQQPDPQQLDPPSVPGQTSLGGQQTPPSLEVQDGLESSLLNPLSQYIWEQRDSEQNVDETSSIPTAVDASPPTVNNEVSEDLDLSDDAQWPRLPPPGTKMSSKRERRYGSLKSANGISGERN
jgi:hypothetical protein